MKLYICIFTLLLLNACSNQATTGSSHSLIAQQSHVAQQAEQFRPLYHFTPAANWMNDPNGMVYYEGEYHLFYQYHPYSNVWGPMHWGHAISKDLLHWQHLPVALAPDEYGTIFSGSVVVDYHNTSGLGSLDNPPMVALFTYHNELRRTAGEQDYQTQGLAYSLDKGRTWVKYQHNPVMPNPGIVDFRDPKVSWFAEQEKWMMVISQGDHIGFYSSKNLLDWQFESVFGQGIGEHGGVWECPDLIRIKVNGTQEYKYVLLVSINPGAPNGGSGTQYFVGDFDGKNFVIDERFKHQLDLQGSLWLDYGTDNYAGVTYANIPEADGRTLFMGWMNNWLYAQQVPTTAWRSAMTIPRSLTLHETPNGLKVFSNPIQELDMVSPIKQQKSLLQITAKTSLTSLFGDLPSSHHLYLQMSRQQAKKIQISYLNQQQETAIITLDVEAGKVSIDRTKSGMVDFQENFSSTQYGPIGANLDVYSLDIFYDKTSLEIFINQGELVMTVQVFPNSAYDEIEIAADNAVILNTISIAKIIPLSSVR